MFIITQRIKSLVKIFKKTTVVSEPTADEYGQLDISLVVDIDLPVLNEQVNLFIEKAKSTGGVAPTYIGYQYKRGGGDTILRWATEDRDTATLFLLTVDNGTLTEEDWPYSGSLDDQIADYRRDNESLF